MENSTQPRPRKKRKLQEPTFDPACPYKDPITHAEASRLLGLTVHDARTFFDRRGISSYKGAKYVSRSRKEVLTKGFFWKYKDKGHCIDFSWAQRITGMHEDLMEQEMIWKTIGDKQYCTAQAVMDALYGEGT